MTAPYGPIDPNSEHQRWSRWVFGVQAGTKRPDITEVRDNFRRWASKGFKSTVGQAQVSEQGGFYSIVLEIEGPPVHDPDYRENVRREFIQRFMEPGFGQGAELTRFMGILLAGDSEDGRPPDQMLVMPAVTSTARLYGL